jgi:hypothetical protein
LHPDYVSIVEAFDETVDRPGGCDRENFDKAMADMRRRVADFVLIAPRDWPDAAARLETLLDGVGPGNVSDVDPVAYQIRKTAAGMRSGRSVPRLVAELRFLWDAVSMLCGEESDKTVLLETILAWATKPRLVTNGVTPVTITSAATTSKTNAQNLGFLYDFQW